MKKKKEHPGPERMSEREQIFIYFVLSRSVHTETGKNKPYKQTFYGTAEQNRIEGECR